MQNSSQHTIPATEAESLFCELSDAIWDVPETCYAEHHAAKLQIDALKKLGFTVEENLANIPTAFSGSWGSGKPVIGLLGEFDALSGLSQEAGIAEKKPITAGGNGHGCGHNLLGTGSIAAAYEIKEYLKATGKEGTVIYYGCPAEEGGSGKAFMARDGVFDGLDCAISWHPSDSFAIWDGSSLANYMVRYNFHGIAAHAAGAPHLGRSALDAVSLMNTGVQYLREHVIQEARIHYAITNSGGISPNVVQAEAEVLYLVRAPKTPQVQEIYERVNDIARGAALMTGTTVDIKFVKACSNLVPSYTLAATMYEKMQEIPLPDYTDEEIAFAEKMSATIPAKGERSTGMQIDAMTSSQKALVRSHMNDAIKRYIVPHVEVDKAAGGSTDVGDVSWICPTVQCTAATEAGGTPAHSWQMVAQGKSTIAHKGMLYAAKVMSATGIELLNDPARIEAAKEELAEHLEHRKYISPIPKDVIPEGLA